MDWHEYTLQKYMEQVDEEERLNDAIDKVLEEIEEKMPNALPDDFDTCSEIGYDIVMNDYDPIAYMEDWLEEHETETNNKENNNENN